MTDVIFKLNFSEINELVTMQEDAIDNFKNEICELFPKMIIGTNTEINFDPTKDLDDSTNISSAKSLKWIFLDDSGKKQVILTSKFLSLHYKKDSYSHFKLFFEDVSHLIDSLIVSYNIDFKNVELRYVNQINDLDISTENINEYIHPNLSKNLIQDFDDDEELIQMISKLNLEKNKYMLTMQYGWFNPNFPSSNSKKEFILDYTCGLYELNSVDDVKENLKDMNKLLWQKFEYSITEKLHKKMLPEGG